MISWNIDGFLQRVCIPLRSWGCGLLAAFSGCTVVTTSPRHPLTRPPVSAVQGWLPVATILFAHTRHLASITQSMVALYSLHISLALLRLEDISQDQPGLSPKGRSREAIHHKPSKRKGQRWTKWIIGMTVIIYLKLSLKLKFEEKCSPCIQTVSI